MQKGFSMLLILLGMLIIAGGLIAGAYYFRTRKSAPTVPSPSPVVNSQIPQPTPPPSLSDETASWKDYTYTSQYTDNLGKKYSWDIYSFKYPPDWKIKRIGIDLKSTLSSIVSPDFKETCSEVCELESGLSITVYRPSELSINFSIDELVAQPKLDRDSNLGIMFDSGGPFNIVAPTKIKVNGHDALIQTVDQGLSKDITVLIIYEKTAYLIVMSGRTGSTLDEHFFNNFLVNFKLIKFQQSIGK